MKGEHTMAREAQEINQNNENGVEITSNYTTRLVEHECGGTAIFPPGLVGEVAQVIYDASARQVPEVALCSALGLFSGMFGRAFNISRTGLNMYVVLVAETGIGKEMISDGINMVLGHMMQLTGNERFMHIAGPTEINSGPGLRKRISESEMKCFVCVLGEFGLMLDSISGPKAGPNEVSKRRAILDLYNKSGATNWMGRSAYAKKDENTEAIRAPALSIVAETTPSTFYRALDEDLIEEGLVPRFMIVEYKGVRPYLNEDAKLVISNRLADNLNRIFKEVEYLNMNERHIDVLYSEEDNAYELLKEFGRMADDKIRNGAEGPVKQLWNRAHLIALRLAALISVGMDWVGKRPVIREEAARWAIEMARNNVEGMLKRYNAGEFGGASRAEREQHEALERIIADYKNLKESSFAAYKVTKEMHRSNAISYEFFHKRMSRLACFRGEVIGISGCIKRALAVAVDRGTLVKLEKDVAMSLYGTTAQVFIDASVMDRKRELASIKAEQGTETVAAPVAETVNIPLKFG